MRLLFVTYRFPTNTYTADKNTTYHLVKYFGRRHEVSLVALAEDSQALEGQDLIKPYVVRSEAIVLPRWRSMLNAARGLLDRDPLQMWYYRCSEMRQRVLQVIDEQKIELIYGYHLRSAQWIANVDRVPCVIAIQPAQVLHFGRRAQLVRSRVKRFIYRMEYERLIGYELTVARRFDRCLLISEKDRLAIDPNRELKNVFYNPHGTDVDLFAPPPNNKREPASVVFAGALSIDTNSDAVLFFVDKILPRIWRQRPDVRFYIVGKNPPASIIRLNKDPRIRVTGFLEDIRPYLWRCSVGVDPIRIAAGMQNKVIEGMAAGLPMVVSPEANEGIGAPEREALVVGKNPEDFATKVLTLINCPEVAQKLSITGRNYVKKYWSWEYHFRQLEGLFFELVTAYREGRKDVDCEKRSIRFALS